VTEQELVKVSALPSETRVQEPPPLKVPPPGPVRLKSTEPEGSDLVPPSVSVTVAVQVPPWLMAREAGQSTEVEVERSVTEMSKLPELVAWVVSPP
jgi:hypothetical protein